MLSPAKEEEKKRIHGRKKT